MGLYRSWSYNKNAKGDANEGCHLIDTLERIITHYEPLFCWPTISANILP